jgi:predicted  nucleic acid-binding Zn-ribbon protein
MSNGEQWLLTLVVMMTGPLVMMVIERRRVSRAIASLKIELGDIGDRFKEARRDVSELEESYQKVNQESTARQVKLLNQEQIIRDMREEIEAGVAAVTKLVAEKENSSEYFVKIIDQRIQLEDDLRKLSQTHDGVKAKLAQAESVVAERDLEREKICDEIVNINNERNQLLDDVVTLGKKLTEAEAASKKEVGQAEFLMNEARSARDTWHAQCLDWEQTVVQLRAENKTIARNLDEARAELAELSRNLPKTQKAVPPQETQPSKQVQRRKQ